MPNCENVMGHAERNRDFVLSLVRRSSDALAAAVAPYAKREVEHLRYNFVPFRASPYNANPHSSTLQRHCCDYDGRGVEIGALVQRHKSTWKTYSESRTNHWEFDGIGFRKTFDVTICDLSRRD